MINFTKSSVFAAPKKYSILCNHWSSIYTYVPKTAEAMFYYHCTIIIFIAATKCELCQKLSSSCHLWLSHTPQRQARTVLKTQHWDNHWLSQFSLVIHINCSGRAKPDISSTWWAFYFTMSGYTWLKGLIILTIASYGSDQLIGSFLANIEPSVKCPAYPRTFLSLWPFQYFAIRLTTRHSLCTLQIYHLTTWRPRQNVTSAWNWLRLLCY